MHVRYGPTLSARGVQAPFGVAYHEIPNGAVKDCVVIIALLAQLNEVLASFGYLNRIEK